MAGQPPDAVGSALVSRWVRRLAVFLFAVSALSTSAERNWAVAGASTVKCGRQPAWAANNSLEACSCEPERITSRPCTRQWLNAAGAGSEIVIDHGDAPWIPGDQEQVSGVHCNISSFHLPAGRTIFIKAWDGSSGGRLILEVQGNVTVEGTLDGSGRGYRGGPVSRLIGSPGYAGESTGTGAFVRETEATSGGVRSGGGGGGRPQVKVSPISFLTVGRPGAGASYGSAGTVGTAAGMDDFSSAGVEYGDSCLNSLYPGSGGGGGAGSAPLLNPAGGVGGNGGASILIYSVAGYISVASGGSVRMDGKNGFGDSGVSCGTCSTSCNDTSPFVNQCHSMSNLSCFDFSGPGGGGSGGAVHLSAGTVDIQGSVSAVGGIGGVGVYELTGCGGNAGVGRVRIDANRIVGASIPAAANDDIFSYCPCNATATTVPTTVPVTTAAMTTTSMGIVLPATSRSGTAGPIPATPASGMAAPSDTTAVPTSSQASSVTVRGASIGSSSIDVGLIIGIAGATLVIITAAIVTVYCTMKRGRKSLKVIVEEPTEYDDSGRAYARFSRVDSGVGCTVCGGARCFCQQPPSISNATYSSDQQIAFSIGTSPAALGAKLPVSSMPEYSSPEDLDTAPNGGAARHFSQRSNGHGIQQPGAQHPVSRDTRGTHTYDQVEGGPGGACAKNGFRNPNYGLRIPVDRQQDPASGGNGAAQGNATSPGSSSYANIMPDSTDTTPGDQRSRLTSFGSDRDIPTDASGYLVAYNRSPSSNNGHLPSGQRSREARNSMHSASSKATVMSAVMVSPEEEQPRVFFQFPESGAGAGAGGARHHQVADARMASAHGGPLHPCLSPLTPPSAFAQPGRESDPARKDSGIEVDASCYAIVTVDITHDTSSQVSSGSEVRRPGSAEPMPKLMSPIPEQLSPITAATAAAGFRARPTDVSAHQYAAVSEILPQLSPGSGSGRACSEDDKSPTFSVSAV